VNFNKVNLQVVHNETNVFKFIPETMPLPDEIEAIRLGREEIKRGETVGHDDIDWS